MYVQKDTGHLSPDVNQALTTRIVVLTPQLQYTQSQLPIPNVDTHYYYTGRGSSNGDIGPNWHGLQTGLVAPLGEGSVTGNFIQIGKC